MAVNKCHKCLCQTCSAAYAIHLMRKMGILLILLLVLGCHRKSDDSRAQFAADVRMESPFAGPLSGKLYVSKGRIRAEMGPIVDVYDTNQKRGWRILIQEKVYTKVPERDVLTYIPGLLSGSPCATVEVPSGCKMVGKGEIQGRAATRWELVNRRGVRVSLWTDDKLHIALLWHIENVTYEATNIQERAVPESMFELPTGYTYQEVPRI